MWRYLENLHPNWKSREIEDEFISETIFTLSRTKSSRKQLSTSSNDHEIEGEGEKIGEFYDEMNHQMEENEFEEKKQRLKDLKEKLFSNLITSLFKCAESIQHDINLQKQQEPSLNGSSSSIDALRKQMKSYLRESVGYCDFVISELNHQNTKCLYRF